MAIFLFTSCNILNNKKIHNNEYIIIDVKLNDTIIKSVFDTGASFFYIDSTFAKKKFNFKNGFDYNIQGVGESETKAFVSTDTIKFSIDNVSYISKVNVVLDLENIINHKTGFVLGNNIFHNKKIFINTIQNTIQTITDSNSVEYSEYEKIPFLYQNGKIIIEAEIFIDKKNSFNGKLLVDTGYPGELSINNKTRIEQSLDKKKKIFYYSNSAGVGGKSKGYRFISKSINISIFKINKIITDCSNDSTGGLTNNQYFDGVIGYGLLKKFHLIIDYKNNILYLNPNSRFKTNFQHPQIGFSYIDKRHEGKGLLINSIIKNSPAEKAGIRLGDKIIEINNIKTENTNNELENLFKNKKNHLKIVRGAKTFNINYNISKIL